MREWVVTVDGTAAGPFDFNEALSRLRCFRPAFNVGDGRAGATVSIEASDAVTAIEFAVYAVAAAFPSIDIDCVELVAPPGRRNSSSRP